MSRAFRLGVFIVGTLLFFAIGVFLIGDREFLFKSTYHLKADFDNVKGLNDGAEVRVGGVHKGTVKRIDLPPRPDERVTVVMDLDTGTRDILKKDSVASIRSEGLVGDKYVEISFGSKDAERLKDWDTIGSQPPQDISDLIKKTDALLDSASGAMQNVEGTTSNLKSISSKINQGQGTVGALVNDKTIYENAKAGTTAFQEDMEALKHNFLLRGFFKKRGYEDGSELTKHEISRLPAEAPVKVFVFDAKQIFDKPDTAKLKNRKPLNEAGKFLEDNKFGLAVVAGFTGMKGDTEKERVLSEARAMVVRDYVAQNFRLDDTRLKTIGLGKTKEANDTSKVEILVYPESGNVASVQKQPAHR